MASQFVGSIALAKVTAPQREGILACNKEKQIGPYFFILSTEKHGLSYITFPKIIAQGVAI